MEKSPPPEWLEQANRLSLVSRLLASTVHDVNNALQVIAGSVELLQMAPAASEMIQRRVTAIDTQAKRASGLLQELSEFVRDSRALTERFDLKALAQAVIASRHYSMSKLRITASVDGESVFVKANPRHVQQILLNLVINSEEALAGTSKEAAAATMAIKVEAKGGQGVVTIIDSGSTPAPSSSNLGIGLEVSTWLAEKNGGSLTREPLAVGSRATLRLPAAP